jgi:hypothetical protein
MKIRPAGAEVFDLDGETGRSTDMMKLIVAILQKPLKFNAAVLATPT